PKRPGMPRRDTLVANLSELAALPAIAADQLPSNPRLKNGDNVAIARSLIDTLLVSPASLS
ncbi:MAG: hypothetical protein AAFU85_34145, partial [Planctomycetota bacterium]